MIWNLLFGLAAGLLNPMFEKWLEGVAESIWLGEIGLTEREWDLLSLVLLLMIAAVLMAILGINGMPFWLSLGALIGLFGRRILNRWRTRNAPR